MAASDMYQAHIDKLLREPTRSLESYGTGPQQQIPDWLRKQSEVGLGQATESAMFRLGQFNTSESFSQSLRDLVKGEGTSGIQGGFSEQRVEDLTEQFNLKTSQLQFDIGRQSDTAKTTALKDIIDVEQFNKNLSFNRQSALASQDLQNKQMKLDALISGRDYEAQKELADDSSWLDTAFNVASLALLIV
jgi:hypothetical protein